MNYPKFDLEKAIAGEPLITRDGREVTEFYYFRTKTGYYPCYAIIDGNTYFYRKTGEHINDCMEHDLDLFMKPKVIEGWVNVYFDGNDISVGIAYNTEEKAKEAVSGDTRYIKTIKIDNQKP